MERNPLNDDFHEFVERILEHYHVPGMALGIVDNDETILKCYGNAKLEGEPATEDTLYYLASVTKSMTATTLLSVLEEHNIGRRSPIDLKTKISDVLPGDFVLQDEYAALHATLEDALCHRLGVASANANYGGQGFTVRDAVRSLRHLPMSGELREKHEYLNLGYMLIQHIVEVLTGKPIEEAHHKFLWDPLGMKSTFPSLSDAKASKEILATGYTWDGLQEELIVAPYANDYPLIGGGGLIISIKDLTAYLHAIINQNPPFTSSKQSELFKPRIIARESNEPHASTNLYALGWNISQQNGHRYVTHNGGIEGFSSQLSFFPNSKWGFAILVNADMNGYAAVENIASRLIYDFVGIPRQGRKDKLAEFDKMLDDMVAGYLVSRQKIYPNLPEPHISLTLPLGDYAGSYFHPGYRTLTFKVAAAPRGKGVPLADHTKEVLHCDIYRLLDLTLDLEHFSGDYFIAWVDTQTGNISVKAGVKAHFTVTPDGRVGELEIDIENNGRLISFKKSGEDES